MFFKIEEVVSLDGLPCYGRSYLMATMTHRNSFALDILHHPCPSFAETDWHKALDRADDESAWKAFVRSVRQGPPRTRSEYDLPEFFRAFHGTNIGFQGGHQLDPDQVVDQHYVGVYGIEHRFEGEIDWRHDPTRDWGERQTREWQVQFNRLYQWVPLADRYRETGDPRYARAFENELRSWVRQCPRPKDNGMGLPGCWRLIEVGIRAGWTWPYALETFRKSEVVSDEAIWLMITALHEHGMHLLLWPTKRNFKAMESNGLTHVGAMFPEFRLAHTFLTTGLDRATAELERQVYPDGLQDELAPSYGIVTLTNLYSAVRAAEPHETFGTEVPRRTWERLANMARALGHIADPDGRLPAIHDSGPQDVTALYAHFFPSPDSDDAAAPWQRTGVDLLPWAGWAILRRPDRYALLDAGPWGTGHQHADALQLLTHAHGRWFCIDPGKPIYNRSALTQYMRSSEGHNVVLVDGRRHRPDPLVRMATEPWPMAAQEVTPALFLTAAQRRATTLEEEGLPVSFQHERVVLDVAELGWVVYDRLHSEDEEPHRWEWLWHLGVERVDLRKEDGGRTWAHALYKGGPGLEIHPIGHGVSLNVAQGQTEPKPRGWQAKGKGDSPTPTPTLSVETGPLPGAVAMLTLLLPHQGEDAPGLDINEALVSPNDTRITIERAGCRFALHLTGDECVETMAFSLPNGEDVSLELESHRFSVG